jgi:C4-dicarboxylate-specific signal transduction histidine kinase
MNNKLEMRFTERTSQLAEAKISFKSEIDERLQAEEALRKSEMKYKTEGVV